MSGRDRRLNVTLCKQPAKIIKDGDKIYLEAPPTGLLINEVSEMEGGRHQGGRLFVVKDTPRNWFTLDILTGGVINGWSKRYTKDASPAVPYQPKRAGGWQHQHKMASFMLTRLQDINAGEMGTGKTFALFETIDFARDRLGLREGVMWWCAPKSALTSLETQMQKWKFYIRGNDRIFNYHRLEREMEDASDWPQIVIFDESDALKIPSSRRTQLAIQLAINMDVRWGDRCMRHLCSGSPQPESYFDWWSQCEIARPGWLREASRAKFERRLAVFSFNDRPGGGVYPVFDKWKEPEIKILPNRLDGLVLPVWKKDCMDLPEKVYETISLLPSTATLRVARHLARTVSRAKLQQKLRQLSDGFLYVDTSAGDEDVEDETDTSSVDLATGRVQIAETPKDQLLKDLLETYSPQKRLVVYAAYQASVDRVSRIAAAEGWKVWQYDGRGQLGGINEDQFNDHASSQERICFVGNPDSAGKGLTLSGSPAIFYFSNSFKGVSRTQSEDRIQRPGATQERGCKIIDCVHLPTDLKVIEAVKQKRNIERVSLEDVLRLLEGGREELQ